MREPALQLRDLRKAYVLDGVSIEALRGIDLVIAGTLEGDIIATDRVEIRPPARIFGSVSAARIAIGEGAVIEGEIHMTGGAQPHRFEEKRHRD